MNDMSSVIVPKSDQWNADDFLAGPRTFTIREVQINPGAEQPVNIRLEGTDKFFRPCKSMSRVLVQAWGPDAKAYIGRSFTLYRDPTVKWGGLEVGGIRISHLSHLDSAQQMMLTATKGSRKPYKVLPLKMEPAEDPAARWAAGYIAKLATFETVEALDEFAVEKAGKLTELRNARADLADEVLAAHTRRQTELQAAAADTFAEFEPEGAEAQ